jgi:hypothetical protein
MERLGHRDRKSALRRRDAGDRSAGSVYKLAGVARHREDEQRDPMKLQDKLDDMVRKSFDKYSPKSKESRGR